MELSDLSQDDLRDLADQARAALEHGAPISESIRRYGIRDKEELKRWLKRVQAELESR
ncbi:MAG: hypothetical protein R3234_00785 [Thermoanaerobaculia bacterium]|nr:hypothetical protein [Thermoanaerobaculia bacterium]